MMASRLPPFFPMRALVVCSALAVMVLWMGGGSAMDALRLLSGLLPVGVNEEGLLRLLLARSLATFGLVTLALILGLWLALAVALFVSHFGGFLSRVCGWMGCALSGVPPMAWALGAILLLIRYLHLPVETLFPYDPPEGHDAWNLRLGRTLWAWLVPAIVLAIPVFGTALHTLTHRISALLNDPLLKPLRGRGLRRALIVYHHLLPELRTHILRMVRPLAAMTLTFAIPVEEAFRFDGWGSFAAAALRGHQAYQIATAVYLAGFMLAAWYAFVGWRQKRRSNTHPPLLVTHPEESRSWFCVFCGLVLAGALLTWPRWWPAAEVWHVSNAPAQQEVLRALAVALAASALIILSGPFMVTRRKWLQSSHAGIATTFAAAPLLLCWLALVSVVKQYHEYAAMLGLVMAAALPGAASFREKFSRVYRRDYVTAALSVGRSPQGIWWRHLFPHLLPSVLNRLFRSVATLLLWCSLLGYYGLDVTFGTIPSWGTQMHQNSELILDASLPALAPAVWLALWSLSFRLLSRAFSPETPRPRTSPFDP